MTSIVILLVTVPVLVGLLKLIPEKSLFNIANKIF